MEVRALDLLARVDLFADLDDDELRGLAGLLEPFEVAAGELLFRQGAAATGLYLIEDGRVAVFAQLFGDREVHLSELGAGELLGELALIDRQPRSAGARALVDARGFFLDIRGFDGLRARLQPSALKMSLRIGRSMCEQLRNLNAQMIAADAATVEVPPADLEERPVDPAWLRIMPSLAALADDELEALAADLRQVEAPRGAVLCAMGAAADRLFIVLHGAIEVQAGPPGSRRLAILGPGKILGHVGFLDDLPRSATCLSRETATLVVLRYEALRALVAARTHLAFKVVDALVQAAAGEVRTASRRRAQQSATGRLGGHASRS